MHLVLLLPYPMETALKSDCIGLALKCSSFLISPTDILLFSSLCCIENDHPKLKCSNSSVVCLGHTQHPWLEESVSPATNWRTTPQRMQPEQNPARICWPSGLPHSFIHWPLAQPGTAGQNCPQFFRNFSQKNSMKVGAGRKTKMKLMSTLLRN